MTTRGLGQFFERRGELYDYETASFLKKAEPISDSHQKVLKEAYCRSVAALSEIGVRIAAFLSEDNELGTVSYFTRVATQKASCRAIAQLPETDRLHRKISARIQKMIDPLGIHPLQEKLFICCSNGDRAGIRAVLQELSLDELKTVLLWIDSHEKLDSLSYFPFLFSEIAKALEPNQKRELFLWAIAEKNDSLVRAFLFSESFREVGAKMLTNQNRDHLTYLLDQFFDTFYPKMREELSRIDPDEILELVQQCARGLGTAIPLLPLDPKIRAALEKELKTQALKGAARDLTKWISMALFFELLVSPLPIVTTLCYGSMATSAGIELHSRYQRAKTLLEDYLKQENRIAETESRWSLFPFLSFVFCFHTVFHELGHKIAADFLCGNTSLIYVLPPLGAVTVIEQCQKTEQNEFLITLAGPCFDLLLSTTELIVAQKTKDPIYQQQLLKVAGTMIFNLFTYAIIGSLFSYGDFAVISKKIPILISLVDILALPLLTYALVIYDAKEIEAGMRNFLKDLSPLLKAISKSSLVPEIARDAIQPLRDTVVATLTYGLDQLGIHTVATGTPHLRPNLAQAVRQRIQDAAAALNRVWQRCLVQTLAAYGIPTAATG